MNIINPGHYNIGQGTWLMGWHIDTEATREERVLDAIEHAQGWVLIDAEPLPSHFKLMNSSHSDWTEWSNDLTAYVSKVQDVKRIIQESRPDLQVGLYGPSPLVYHHSRLFQARLDDASEGLKAREPEFLHGIFCWKMQMAALHDKGVFDGVDALLPPFYNSANYDPSDWVSDSATSVASAVRSLRIEAKVIPCVWHRWSNRQMMSPEDLESYAEAIRAADYNFHGYVLWCGTLDKQEPNYKPSSPPTPEADEATVRLMRLLVE